MHCWGNPATDAGMRAGTWERPTWNGAPVGTALMLLAILVAATAIPLLVIRRVRRCQSDVDGYLDQQHSGDTRRKGSWPYSGGGYIGLGWLSPRTATKDLCLRNWETVASKGKAAGLNTVRSIEASALDRATSATCVPSGSSAAAATWGQSRGRSRGLS